MRHRTRGLLPLAIFILLLSSSHVHGGVTLDFGEAVVLDQSVAAVPIGDFRAETILNIFHKATSDNYVLLLVNTPWNGVWSMVRTTREGELIDTIPQQMRSPSDDLSFLPYSLTWSAPYFYLWEIENANIYFTRLTEDLTLVDISPQLLTSIAGKKLINAGGSQVWMMDDHQHVWGYDAGLESVFVDRVTIVGWRSMTGVPIRGLVDNGLYVSRRNPIDSVTDLAYISEDGEVSVLAPAVFNDNMFESSPHSTDSVLFWKISDSAFLKPLRFQYFFASRSDSLAAKDFHEVDVSDYLPKSKVESFASLGQSGFLTGALFEEDDRWYAMSIDFAGDSIISFRYFGARSLYFNANTAISQSGDSITIFYRMNNGIEMTRLSGVELTTINGPHPILYGRGYQSWPSMIRDSLGLLIYLSEGTDEGSTIAGYRISNPVVNNVANPLRIETPFPDSTLIRPHIFKEIQTKGLFWMERLPDDISGYQSRDYYKKVTLFEGDSPTLTEMEAAHVLNTTPSVPSVPPRTIRIRDTLYIVSGMLQSIDLVENELTELFANAYGGASSIMLNRADTLTFLTIGLSCVSSCGNFGCCTWRRFLAARDYINDEIVSYYSSGWLIGGERDAPEFQQFLQGAYSDGQYYVALSDPPSIQMVDFVSQSSTPTVDLAPLLSSSLDYYKARPREFLIPYNGLNIVFYFRYDFEPHQAFVFDNNWNLVTQQEIPLAGAIQEIAGIDFTSDSSAMILTYTSFLPYPYSTERCLLQTISIDISTDVAEEPMTPNGFKVAQNYPNPFNPSTVIEYSLPKRCHVTLSIFNVLGQEVLTLVDRVESQGQHTVIWNGDDNNEKPIASGVYFYRILTESYSETRKMLLLR